MDGKKWYLSKTLWLLAAAEVGLVIGWLSGEMTTNAFLIGTLTDVVLVGIRWATNSGLLWCLVLAVLLMPACYSENNNRIDKLSVNVWYPGKDKAVNVYEAQSGPPTWLDVAISQAVDSTQTPTSEVDSKIDAAVTGQGTAEVTPEQPPGE